jgi:hypothetical protein
LAGKPYTYIVKMSLVLNTFRTKKKTQKGIYLRVRGLCSFLVYKNHLIVEGRGDVHLICHFPLVCLFLITSLAFMFQWGPTSFLVLYFVHWINCTYSKGRGPILHPHMLLRTDIFFFKSPEKRAIPPPRYHWPVMIVFYAINLFLFRVEWWFLGLRCMTSILNTEVAKWFPNSEMFVSPRLTTSQIWTTHGTMKIPIDI